MAGWTTQKELLRMEIKQREEEEEEEDDGFKF